MKKEKLIITIIIVSIPLLILCLLIDLPYEFVNTREKNILDEIYYALSDEKNSAAAVEWVDASKVLCGTFTEDISGYTTILCNSSEYDNPQYPGLSHGDRMYILQRDEDSVLSFLYVSVRQDGSELIHRYDYSPRTHTLTYVRPKEEEPKDFLSDLLLPMWLSGSGGISDFTYNNFGEYRYKELVQ